MSPKPVQELRECNWEHLAQYQIYPDIRLPSLTSLWELISNLKFNLEGEGEKTA